MESLGYIMLRNIESLGNMGIKVSEARSIGGGARSAIWSQIQADVTGIRIVTMQSREAPCLGAAILAGKGIGVFRDLEEAVSSMAVTKDSFDPNQENRRAYKEGYEMYKKLFSDLTGCFEKTL
jgi:xylulokinase